MNRERFAEAVEKRYMSKLRASGTIKHWIRVEALVEALKERIMRRFSNRCMTALVASALLASAGTSLCGQTQALAADGGDSRMVEPDW